MVHRPSRYTAAPVCLHRLTTDKQFLNEPFEPEDVAIKLFGPLSIEMKKPESSAIQNTRAYLALFAAHTLLNSRYHVRANALLYRLRTA